MTEPEGLDLTRRSWVRLSGRGGATPYGDIGEDACHVCHGTGELYSALLAEDVDCLICSGSGIYTGPGGVDLTIYHGDDETCERVDCYHCFEET